MLIFLFLIFSLLLNWGTLWHLPKCLHCIIVEFTPPSFSFISLPSFWEQFQQVSLFHFLTWVHNTVFLNFNCQSQVLSKGCHSSCVHPERVPPLFLAGTPSLCLGPRLRVGGCLVVLYWQGRVTSSKQITPLVPWYVIFKVMWRPLPGNRSSGDYLLTTLCLHPIEYRLPLLTCFANAFLMVFFFKTNNLVA
jgi:hypothetical protein